MRPFRPLGPALVLFVACNSTSASPKGDAGGPANDGGVTLDTGVDAGGEAEAAVPETCSPVLTGGTMHGGSVTQPETWTEAGSPYLLPYDTEITATLTIEQCATVLIGAQRTITVSAGGSIVTRGLGLRPVFIQNKDSANWASIRTLGGTLDLVGTLISGGGDPLNGSPDFAAVLDIRADATKPPMPILHAAVVSISGSMSQGVYLHESGTFDASSTQLSISASKGYPIHASANLAGTIPDGSYKQNNGVDEILISGGDAGQTISSSDVTFHDRGVPYHIGASSEEGRMDVGGQATMASLTIEPNVTLRFKKGGSLYVDYQHGTTQATGTLIAVGTQAKPIVFTSAEPTQAAGDWLGLNFGDLPNGNNKLDFVTVAFAGGASTSGSSSCPYTGFPISDAAIRLYGGPATAFITNTTVTDSLANGIDRGWPGNNAIDFLADGTNKFTRVNRCWQTAPNNGACPTPPPCPM